MTKFQGLTITGPSWSWVWLSKKEDKFYVRYWIASQSRYKTFSDVAAEKQSHHCAPHCQAYIHIATEELISDISSMNSLAEFFSEASLQLSEHKT